MGYIGVQPAKGQYRKLTDISSSFNGVLTSFQLSVPPGGVNYYIIPSSPQQLLISLNNVIKNPGVDYTVTGSQIVFTTAPTGGLSFFGTFLGDVGNGVSASGVDYIATGTGAVTRTTASKLADTVSVKDFGAVGDGVTNDTAAIQAALNACNVIYVPNGTYLCGALTFNSQNVLKGESRSGSVLTYTGSTTFITGGSDLNRIGLENLTILESNNPSGYALFFDSSTTRQPRIVNVAIGGFAKGIRIDDALNGWMEQVYIEGQGAGVASGVGLQFGESPSQAGTTWQVNNVYINSFETAVKTWSSASMFNTLIIENCTTGFYSSAAATVIAPWFEVVTTEFDLYLNGICIIAPRWANVNPQVNVDSTVTYSRTTIIPCSGDTSPIYDPSWKLGYLNIWRTGEIQQDLLQSQPTPSFNFSINPSANYSHGIERKTTTGTGYTYELRSGGAKSGTTNTDGGDLYLSSGISTGSGGSDVYIATSTPGSSGTSDISPNNKWIFYRDGRFFPAADGLYNIGTTASRAKRVHTKEGYVVTTPDGTKNYLIAVDNAGNLTTTLV